MKISLIQALKSPFEIRMLIPCAFWAVTLLFYLFFMQGSHTYFSIEVSLPIFIILGIITQIVSIGYTLSFSNNVLQDKKPLFENLSLKILLMGLKSIVFGIACYLFVLILALPLLLVIKFTPNWFSVPFFLLSVIFSFLYILAAWTKFTYTLRMSEPLRILSITSLLFRNILGYLKILFYTILSSLVLLPPILILKLASGQIVDLYPVTIFIAVFFFMLLSQYPVYVVFHIMAQGYKAIQQKTSSQHPTTAAISTTDTVVTETKQPAKQNKAKATTLKKRNSTPSAIRTRKPVVCATKKNKATASVKKRTKGTK